MVSRRDAGTDKHDREENSLISTWCLDFVTLKNSEEILNSSQMCIILCISIQYYIICQTLTAWNTSNFQENGSLTRSVPLLDFAAFLK